MNMQKTVLSALAVIIVVAAGWYGYKNYHAAQGGGNPSAIETTTTSTAGVADQGFGVYSYECDEHVTFAIAPAPDMSTIHIAALAGAYPPDTVLVKDNSTSSARYTGGGVVFAAHGETVTLGEGDSAINCSPIDVPGEAPFNFGD